MPLGRQKSGAADINYFEDNPSPVKNSQAIERESNFLARGVLRLQAFGVWWPKSLQFCV
jgi:hypothetical protein